MALLQSYSAVFDSETAAPKFKVFTRKDIDDIRELQSLSAEERLSMKAVSAVLPFRVNNYVIEELIDWNNIPADPIFQLTFPQPGMLERKDFARMLELVKKTPPPTIFTRRRARFRTNSTPIRPVKWS